MKLVNPTEILDTAIGLKESISLLKYAGFGGIDLSLFDMFQDDSVWCQDNYREYAREIRSYAESLDIFFLQSHAPFPSTKGEPEFDEMAFSRIVRAMEIASIAGVPRIVVHPPQHLPYVSNKKALFDMSVDFYKRLIPYCEQFQIQVCAENMWQWDEHRQVITDSVCSQPEEFCALIDAVGSPWIVACLDIGHCGLVGVNPADAIRMLGRDRLKALHVHDVDYRHDCHTMPFLENLDWESITTALGEIGYEGHLTFEANCFFQKLPRELWVPGAALLQRTGRYLISRIEEHSEAETE